MTESITNLSAADRESMLDAVQDRLADGARRADIGPRPADRPAPASFAQRRHWFSDRLRPGDPAYNVPLALRLDGRSLVPLMEGKEDSDRVATLGNTQSGPARIGLRALGKKYVRSVQGSPLATDTLIHYQLRITGGATTGDTRGNR